MVQSVVTLSMKSHSVWVRMWVHVLSAEQQLYLLTVQWGCAGSRQCCSTAK